MVDVCVAIKLDPARIVSFVENEAAIAAGDLSVKTYVGARGGSGTHPDRISLNTKSARPKASLLSHFDKIQCPRDVIWHGCELCGM